MPSVEPDADPRVVPELLDVAKPLDEIQKAKLRSEELAVGSEGKQSGKRKDRAF
jgi:hypothetical protein